MFHLVIVVFVATKKILARQYQKVNGCCISEIIFNWAQHQLNELTKTHLFRNILSVYSIFH